MAANYQSWGRYPRASHQAVPLFWRHQCELPSAGVPMLAYGMGRSYGDCCLNDGGMLLDTRALDHFIDFDRETGWLTCEAGVTLDTILREFVPRGWFLPVTPGTRFVTIGGAIANDVHGKNHHRAGTFGCFVREFDILRSNGERLRCSRHENAGLFRATIGGLGLTGLILSAAVQLRPIHSSWIDVEVSKFADLDGFMRLSESADRNYEYTVAWLDCLASGTAARRGVFIRGNHAGSPRSLSVHSRPKLAVPFDFPALALNRASLTLFNRAYYAIQRETTVPKQQHYAPFFYPLDSVQHWNRIYGRRGFLQYQFVVPESRAVEVIDAVLARAQAAGQPPFLSVLKKFGAVASPGMLSFPRPGVTLALDFPHRGPATPALLARLDELVIDAGGALYPAKDACMAPASFAASFPRLAEFEAHHDPGFSSSFWRRVRGPEGERR